MSDYQPTHDAPTEKDPLPTYRPHHSPAAIECGKNRLWHAAPAGETCSPSASPRGTNSPMPEAVPPVPLASARPFPAYLRVVDHW